MHTGDGGHYAYSPFGNHDDPYFYSFRDIQFQNCMRVYTTFPSKVKPSVGIESWLQPWVLRIVMSTETRNICFDGQPNSNAIRWDISQN